MEHPGKRRKNRQVPGTEEKKRAHRLTSSKLKKKVKKSVWCYAEEKAEVGIVTLLGIRFGLVKCMIVR